MEAQIRTWNGAGWQLTVEPGLDPVLQTDGGDLVIDDQDVREFAEAILGCTHDRLSRSFESCFGASGGEFYSVFVSCSGECVVIDPQYTKQVHSLPSGDALMLASALLSAGEHSECGPCPRCGASLADEHPANGCPE